MALRAARTYTYSNYSFVGQVAYDDLSIQCFVSGTRIETATGEALIEGILVGDMIRTLDNGLQPVRWVGSSKVVASGAFAPVVFAKGSIGNTRELRVSPAHRLLVSGPQAEVLFDAHEIIISDGAKTESFHPEHATLSALDQASKAEIEAIFPQLSSYGGPARTVLAPHEAVLLTTRS